jgi:hypothetical protein
MESQELTSVMKFEDFIGFIQQHNPAEYLPDGYNLCPIGSLAWPGYTVWVIGEELSEVLRRGV